MPTSRRSEASQARLPLVVRCRHRTRRHTRSHLNVALPLRRPLLRAHAAANCLHCSEICMPHSEIFTHASGAFLDDNRNLSHERRRRRDLRAGRKVERTPETTGRTARERHARPRAATFGSATRILPRPSALSGVFCLHRDLLANFSQFEGPVRPPLSEKREGDCLAPYDNQGSDDDTRGESFLEGPVAWSPHRTRGMWWRLGAR